MQKALIKKVGDKYELSVDQNSLFDYENPYSGTLNEMLHIAGQKITEYKFPILSVEAFGIKEHNINSIEILQDTYDSESYKRYSCKLNGVRLCTWWMDCPRCTDGFPLFMRDLADKANSKSKSENEMHYLNMEREIHKSCKSGDRYVEYTMFIHAYT